MNKEHIIASNIKKKGWGGGAATYPLLLSKDTRFKDTVTQTLH